jgi:ech hydrogenase subunit C
MQGLTQSPWILHYDASSCNGCDIETLACLTPLYDVERLGVINTGNPKHADIFLVTGAVNEQSKVVIKNLYRQMPEPKVVVAVGACASTGGIFRECYNISGGVDMVVPVDVYVPGCAARPEAIIDGVVKGLGVMVEKRAMLAAAKGKLDQALYAPASKSDAAGIHSLRKVVGQAEAEKLGDESHPMAQQTAAELEQEMESKTFFKAVLNGKVIGSVCGSAINGTVSIEGFAVHPYFNNTVVARRLLGEIEGSFGKGKEFHIAVGEKSDRLLTELAQSGYQRYKMEPFSPKITRVWLKKEKEGAGMEKS